MTEYIDNQIPTHLICPISLELINNPFITNCGHTYDKSSIDTHLEKEDFCPLCRNKITEIKPNFILTSVIDNYKKNNNIKDISEKKNDHIDEKNKCYCEVNNNSVKISYNNYKSRRRAKIVLVIDVSYSMSTEVNDSNKEMHGFS